MAGIHITVAVAVLLLILAAPRRGARPAAPRPPPARPAAARQPDRHAGDRSAERRRAEPGLGPGRRRANPSSTASATPACASRSKAPRPRTTSRSTSSTQPAKSSAASTATTSNRTSAVGIRWDGTTSEGRPARNGHYSFRVGAAGRRPASRRPRPSTSSRTAQPRLRPLRLRLPDPRRRTTSAGRRPLRRRALRPHPPGPGRDGRLRHAAGRRPRRHGPVLRLPERRRQLHRHRRQGHAASTSSTCTWPNPRRCRTGEPVRTGQPIGIVGDTGDATACHLHFEIWTAPGWYEGGSPIDPLPYLEEVGRATARALGAEEAPQVRRAAGRRRPASSSRIAISAVIAASRWEAAAASGQPIALKLGTAEAAKLLVAGRHRARRAPGRSEPPAPAP